MKKKLLITLLLAVCCFAAVFASNQIRTSISPYSFQKISSTSETQKSFDTDYGYGMKFGYIRSFDNGLSFGVEAGIFDYYLPDTNGNGNCVECPVYAKLGYYSPGRGSKTLRYFIFADLGLRILHVTDETSGNFSAGVEVGVSKKMGNGLSLVLSGEPRLAFSENSTSKDDFTDFVCAVNLGFGYDF